MRRSVPVKMTSLARAAFLALGLVSLACAGAGPGGRGERPNIIVFLADDLGWADVGYHGGGVLTPHIDDLAARGVRLERFYTSPKCTPARARLMTGRWAIRFDLLDNVNPRHRASLPRDASTLPALLGDAGYQTALIGKWHLGDDRPGAPNEHGFDLQYGILGGWIDHFTHRRGSAPDWYRNGRRERERGYATDLLTREALSWIRGRDPARPFFLYMAHTLPHTPIQPPPGGLTDAYRDVEDRSRRVYSAMVTALDRSIGRVLDLVRDEGLSENTLVLFLSDNGATEEYGGSNAPLRSGKYDVFEGGIRVPAVVSWPGTLPEGRVSEQLVTGLDVLPTLLQAAAIPDDVPRDGGVSMLVALAREERVPRDDLFFGVEGRSFVRLALLRDGLKLVYRYEHDDKTEETLLFDVITDPTEATNLAGERPELVEEMTARLGAWWRLHPAPDRWPVFPAGPERAEDSPPFSSLESATER